MGQITPLVLLKYDVWIKYLHELFISVGDSCQDLILGVDQHNGNSVCIEAYTHPKDDYYYATIGDQELVGI